MKRGNEVDGDVHVAGEKLTRVKLIGLPPWSDSTPRVRGTVTGIITGQLTGRGVVMMTSR